MGVAAIAAVKVISIVDGVIGIVAARCIDLMHANARSFRRTLRGGGCWWIDCQEISRALTHYQVAIVIVVACRWRRDFITPLDRRKR